MKNLTRTLFLMTLLLVITGGAQATMLTDLFGGQTITAGDKLFDSWTLNLYDSSDQTRTFNSDNINVTSLNDGGLDPGPGLDFSVMNGELDVTGDNYLELNFSFRVSLLDPSYMIKDNSLAIGSAGLLNIAADLGMTIDESIGTAFGLDDLGFSDVEFSDLVPNPILFDLNDSATFDPMSIIWVTKDIRVWATDGGETASLQSFNQRFSQTVVPEPSTFLLLGGGLAGLALVARRRRKE